MADLPSTERATRVVPPGELLRELEGRAAPRMAARSRRAIPRRRSLVGGFGATLVATFLVGVGLVAATSVVDLTTADSTATINGAVYTQGQPVPVSGTGVLDPFLRISDNQDVERGIATDSTKVLNNDDSWTKALLLSNVPVIQLTPGGTQYREFLLDINQTNNNPLLSLDELKIFLTSTPLISSYVDGGLTGGGTLNGTVYTAGSGIGHMVFSQGDNIVELNYSLEAGSGKPDVTVLIPDSVVAGPDYCGYAEVACNTWMGFYSQFGGWNGTNISGTGSLWPNNDGFEEWATIIRPVVNVTKTVNATASTSCAWDITKDVDKTHVDIAQGGTATFNYTVDVTHTCTTTVNPVTGDIVITNPATLPDGTATPDATVTSVTDVFTPGDIAGTVTCAGGFPFTLGSGQSKTCTYSLALGSATNGTNTATVTLSDTSVAPSTASAAVNFSTTLTDTSVNVVDDKTDPQNPVSLGTASYLDSNPKEFTYSITKSGVAGTCTDYTNTATFTTNTTSTTGSASQTVTVCVGKDLTVSKTAAGTFDRLYLWDITKDVDKTKVTVSDSNLATFNYTVTVTQTGFTDSGWNLAGTITVTNPNDWEAISLSAVGDVVDNGGTCSVQSGPWVIPASGHLDIPYTCSYASQPSSYSGTNTASVAWDKAAYSTPTGNASGSKTFTLTQAGSTNKTVTVTDTLGGSLGTVTATDSMPFASKSFQYSHDFAGVGGTCKDYDNTATIVETGQEASKTVTVCAGLDLTASKTAAGTFNRTYLWEITKDVDKTKVTVSDSNLATFNYTVTVTQTGFTDSGWTLAGVITITNPNDFEDITLSGLTDTVDNGGTCTVAAGPYVIPKSGHLDVAYSCSYSSASSLSGTNTATATWDKDAYFTPTGSAMATKAFTLSGAGSTNKTITVTDTLGGSLGTATATDSAPFTTKDFTYSHDFAGVGGTCKDYDNTATIVETGQDASKTVTVCAGLDLTVTKTAVPTFTRTYAWDIQKNVDKTSVTINNGGSATFNYTVSVHHDDGTDSAWATSGTITVTNPNDFEAITFDLADVVDNGGTCTITGGGTGISVPASSSVTKNYTCTWASAPSTPSGVNTATATWDSAAFGTPTGSASGSAGFAFTSPTSVVDECVTVTDTIGGTLGQACVGDANPKSFTYSRTIAPADYGNVCGTVTFDNTATFTTNDTATKGSASQTVSVTVINCGVPGKTPGFWGNQNGHAILDKNKDGMLDTPVTIGVSGYTGYFQVTTIAQSDKILSNDDCTSGSPTIFVCTGPNGLRAGINTNSFEVLGAQTLALTYNIGNITGFSGQTLSALGVNAYITSSLTALGVTPSTTVNELLAIANTLIADSFKGAIPGSPATQAQIGAMNSLLSQVNRETL